MRSNDFHDGGDFEQQDSRPIYKQCDYECMYTLAGLEEGRMQVQVLHEADPCCFRSGPRHDAIIEYNNRIEGRLAATPNASGTMCTAATTGNVHEVSMRDKALIAYLIDLYDQGGGSALPRATECPRLPFNVLHRWKTDDGVQSSQNNPLPWRGWTLLNTVGGPQATNWTATVEYIRDEVLPAAMQLNVTHLQLSQQLSWNAEDFDNPTARAAVSQIAEDCRHVGVHSSIWTHELSSCPNSNLKDGICVLDDVLWDWLAAKYRKLWLRMPSVDGVVLTISETAFDVTCEAEPCRVASNLTVPQRLVKLIRTVMSASRGKTVIMRAFVHTHANLNLMLTALHELAEMPPSEAELVIMAKAPPCDWHPYFPFNPLWNQWNGDAAALSSKGIKLVMEVDLGLEMLGQNQFIAPMIEPVCEMVKQARLLGAVGLSARIERSCLVAEVSTTGSCRKLASGKIQPNTQVLGSMNEVSLIALTAYLLDNNATVPEIWEAWSQRRGFDQPGAAAHLERILGPVYDAVARAYFPLQQWTTQHSNIALSKIIHADLTSYVVTDTWIPSPSLAIANRKLLHTRPSDVLDLMDDQSIPSQVLQRSMASLQQAQAQGVLLPSTIEDLRSKLNFTATGVALLRDVHLTAFGTQALLGLKSAMDRNITCGSVPGDKDFLRSLVGDAMSALRNASAAGYMWPMDRQNLESFVKDAEDRLASLEPVSPPRGYKFVGNGACRDDSGHFPQWGEDRGTFIPPQCAQDCTRSASCEGFMISAGGCQFFCDHVCKLCPHEGNGGRCPTKGDGTLGQSCMLKDEPLGASE